MQDVKPDDTELKRARNTAYRFLTIRARSCAEIEKKLLARSYPPDIISSVIRHLLHLGYLNDETFARQWAESRLRTRGYGRRRIEQELRTKGVSRDIIRATLEGLYEDSTELDIAGKEAEKKLRSLTSLEPEVRRRRIAGFLERRGFPSEVIRVILRRIT